MQFHKEFYHKVPVLLTHIKSTSIIFDPNLNFDMLHCLCHKRFKVILVFKFLEIFLRSCVVNFNAARLIGLLFFFLQIMYNNLNSNHQIYNHDTVKLGNKERFDKEQIGIKEPFPVTNLPFTS